MYTLIRKTDEESFLEFDAEVKLKEGGMCYLYCITEYSPLEEFTIKVKPVYTEPPCSPRNENLNLLVRIKFLNLFYIYLNKNWKFTGRNQVLLVLGQRTSAYREDCPLMAQLFIIFFQFMSDFINLLSGQWTCVRASKVLICTGPSSL